MLLRAALEAIGVHIVSRGVRRGRRGRWSVLASGPPHRPRRPGQPPTDMQLTLDIADGMLCEVHSSLLKCCIVHRYDVNAVW